MSGIICAIRGGAASQPTLRKAIKTAQETELPLYFLYVVNLDFLMQAGRSRTQTISRELHALGEFILLTAQAQAEARGIAAHTVLREGDVRDEIVKLCQIVQADFVVLGRPQADRSETVFSSDLLTAFEQRLMTEAGVRVIFAAEGDA